MWRNKVIVLAGHPLFLTFWLIRDVPARLGGKPFAAPHRGTCTWSTVMADDPRDGYDIVEVAPHSAVTVSGKFPPIVRPPQAGLVDNGYSNCLSGRGFWPRHATDQGKYGRRL